MKMGYKAVGENGYCRDMKFSEGENSLGAEEQIHQCSHGIHACSDIRDIQGYYSLFLNDVWVVNTQDDENNTDGYNYEEDCDSDLVSPSGGKFACRTLNLVRKLDTQQIIQKLTDPLTASQINLGKKFHCQSMFNIEAVVALNQPNRIIYDDDDHFTYKFGISYNGDFNNGVAKSYSESSVSYCTSPNDYAMADGNFAFAINREGGISTANGHYGAAVTMKSHSVAVTRGRRGDVVLLADFSTGTCFNDYSRIRIDKNSSTATSFGSETVVDVRGNISVVTLYQPSGALIRMAPNNSLILMVDGQPQLFKSGDDFDINKWYLIDVHPISREVNFKLITDPSEVTRLIND